MFSGHGSNKVIKLSSWFAEVNSKPLPKHCLSVGEWRFQGRWSFRRDHGLPRRWAIFEGLKPVG